MITTETQFHYVLALGTAVLQRDTDKRPRSGLAAALFVSIPLQHLLSDNPEEGAPTGS